jgi:hypothetical protein
VLLSCCCHHLVLVSTWPFAVISVVTIAAVAVIVSLSILVLRRYLMFRHYQSKYLNQANRSAEKDLEKG